MLCVPPVRCRSASGQQEVKENHRKEISKTICPPPQNEPPPFARIGAWGRNRGEGKGEKRGTSGTGRGCRHSTGKENKVKFGNQMTVMPRLLFSPAAFVSAAPKYLFLKCCKRRTALTPPVFSAAASGKGGKRIISAL